MSKLVNALVLGIAGFVLLVGSIWYVTVAHDSTRLSVTKVSSTWVSADENVARLSSEITFSNRYDVESRYLGLTYSLFLGEDRIASAQVRRATDLKPRQDYVDHVVLDVPSAFAAKWWARHVGDDEHTRAVFKGDATFRFGTTNRTIAFTAEPTWDTTVRGSLESGAQNCPQPDPDPCIDEAGIHWEVDQGVAVLMVSLKVRNNGPDRIVVSDRSAELRFQDLSVGRADDGGDLLIDAGDFRHVDFAVFLRSDDLRKWWPRHVNACEESRVDLRVAMAYRVDAPQPEPTPTPGPSPSPSPSPSPQPTNSTSPPPTAADSGGLVLRSFRVDPSVDGGTATWDFEADDLVSEFACDHGK